MTLRRRVGQRLKSKAIIEISDPKNLKINIKNKTFNKLRKCKKNEFFFDGEIQRW